MKRLVILLAALVLLFAPLGCVTESGAKAHPEAIAKKTLDGIADSVDVAMKVWAHYVVMTRLSEEKQRAVKDAHDRYRLIMGSVTTVVRELRAKPEPGGYDRAVKLAEAASDELIKLIYAFTEKVEEL